MNENNLEHEKVLPIIDHNGRKFICLPNRTEMTFPDGTVYRVSSTFVGKTEMGDMLDALTIEKSTARWLEMMSEICYNFSGFLIENALHNRR